MALWIGNQIDGPEGLFYSSKEKLEEKGAVIHMETDIEKIDFNNKIVYAETKDGKKYQKLMIKSFLLQDLFQLFQIYLEKILKIFSICKIISRCSRGN